MLPKSSKHFIGPTSKELNCDKSLVDDIVGFYYGELRKNLSNLKEPVLRIENLGSFKMKVKELPKLKYKYDNHLALLKGDTFNQMTLRKDLELRLERVTKAYTKVMLEKKRRAEFMKFKNERIKKDLGE